MPNNYILIDYENVQPEDVSSLDHPNYHVVVLLGPAQSKLPTELVVSVHRLKDRAEYLKVPRSGPNALDMALAFTTGRLAATDPKAYFHIVSKDGDFDALLEFMKACGIKGTRCASVHEVPAPKVAAATPNGTPAAADGGYGAAVQQLFAMKQARPRKPETLKSTLKAILARTEHADDDRAVEALFQCLVREKVVRIKDTAVHYAFDAVPAS